MSPTFYSSPVIQYCTKAVTRRENWKEKKLPAENLLVKNRKQDKTKNLVFDKFGSIVSHHNGWLELNDD